MKKDYNWLN